MSRAGALVVRRLVLGVVVLALLSFLVYVGVDLLPGDPATARLGPSATPERIAQARQYLGLDRPVLGRYAEWAAGVLRGDFGTSATGRRVGEMLSDRVGNSVLLTGLAVVLLMPLSLLLGVVAANRRMVSAGALLLVSVPEFVVAAGLVVLFAVVLPIFPAISFVPPGTSPLDRPSALVLPVLSLLLSGLAYAIRVIRGTAVAALRSAPVEFLRLSGIPSRTVLRHVVVPAVAPVAVQVWAVTAAGLLGGTVLVERVFGYPGLGELLVSSVLSADLPVVQALVLILGAVTVFALVVADLAAVLLTPRMRWSR
ncbi:ABC transporter permease [Amycolatopsis jejuensis]|uniref:ABC transporter permease n=1 Tax=Amycolatopsis jejuensis TaxID=330084 RepID=UPI000526456A|nr:ABC transporter permease [Amycolatopsis jejuensis]